MNQVYFVKGLLKGDTLEPPNTLFHMSNVTSSDNLISNSSDWCLNTIFKEGYFENLQSKLRHVRSKPS